MEGASSAQGGSSTRRTSKSSGGGASSDPDQPGRLLQSLKRQTVPTACDNCRSKKVKVRFTASISLRHSLTLVSVTGTYRAAIATAVPFSAHLRPPFPQRHLNKPGRENIRNSPTNALSYSSSSTSSPAMMKLAPTISSLAFGVAKILGRCLISYNTVAFRILSHRH